MDLELIETPTVGEWAAAIERAVRSGAETVLLLQLHAVQPVTGERIIEYANRNRIPVLFADAAAAESGGLLSLGTSLADDVRRAADLLARVLKGAKPAELPVDQAARFELVLNLKTARAIGLTVPQSVLLRADRVIE
jgi:putative ABC transport system substrate-binding protein